MKRRVFGIAAVLGVIASIAAWTAAAGSQRARLQAPVTLPFKLVTRHMVLPVAVNNSRPLAFVLDTGNRTHPSELLGHPLIDAQVTAVGKSPISGTFVIDLGSGGALALHSPFVAEHRLPGPDVKTIA